MNVLSPFPMDRAAFLAWAEGREGRYELAKGRVVMMTGGSRGHALIVRRLANALEKRIDSAQWVVLTSDFAADVGPNTVRYPDVIIDTAGGTLRDLTATSPALIAEILSPSSVTADLGDKSAEYLRLPSLLAYLVLAQDQAKAWVWTRSNSDFGAAPDVVAGDEGIVRIPPLSIELPLFEIYQEIFPAESQG